MDRWTDYQNFAAAGKQREEIASVHRAAIRSIQRVVSENATPHDEEYASAGIAELLKAGKVLVLTGAGVTMTPPANATGRAPTWVGAACAAPNRTAPTMRSPSWSSWAP